MAFIGLSVPPEVGAVHGRFDVPGKRSPREELHVTVHHLGKDVPIDQVAKAAIVAFGAARRTFPFQVSTRVISSFDPGDDGVPIIARIESPELHKLRQTLSGAFDAAAVEYSKKFKTFQPHVTLAYADLTERPVDRPIAPISWPVNEIVVWGGDQGSNYIVVKIPLEGGPESVTAMKVAARVGARPIPMDVGRVTTETFNVQREILRVLKKLPPDEPLGVRKNLVVMKLDSLEGQRTVRHESIKTPVLSVGSAQVSSTSPLVGASYDLQAGHPVIHLDLNSRMPPSFLIGALSDRSGMLEIRNKLLHEMTHALDVQTESTYHTNDSDPYGIDKDRYYNDPTEVRAFMRQIADETIRYAEKQKRAPVPASGPKLVQDALRKSPVWNQVRKHLSPKNTAILLKGVYRALQDAGFDIGGDDYAFLFSDV